MDAAAITRACAAKAAAFAALDDQYKDQDVELPDASEPEAQPSPHRQLIGPKPPPHVGAMLRGRLFLGVFDPQISKPKLIKPVLDDCMERVYAEAQQQWKEEAEQRRGRGRGTGTRSTRQGAKLKSLNSLSNSTEPSVAGSAELDDHSASVEEGPSGSTDKDPLPSAASIQSSGAQEQAMQKYEETVLQILKGTWQRLSKYDSTNLQSLFAEPVDLEANPDYKLKIAKPMDLSTIQSKVAVQNGRNRGPHEYSLDLQGFSSLKGDVQLMLDNCIEYNSSVPEYCEEAKKLQVRADRVFEEDLQKLQNAASARDRKLQSSRS
ncbi:hypothetical protein WJX84_002672 [Apatococcus fuscideae]|uniref:Bromo domain-containing protein n=1 Tax=Apatococcus fuscideae TaxID=2026836 RepID=A0AAW1SGY7_9CHLO